MTNKTFVDVELNAERTAGLTIEDLAAFAYTFGKDLRIACVSNKKPRKRVKP